MAILDRLRAAAKAPTTVTTGDLPPSPWSDDSHLFSPQPLLSLEAVAPTTRSAAMRVPAHARSRGLLVTTIARCALEQITLTGELTSDQPSWLTNAGPGMTPYHRMLWTVDDLIHLGVSLWRITRLEGTPIMAEWWPPSLWSINQQTREIMIAEKPGDTQRSAAIGEAVLIAGPHEGVLNFGASTLRAGASLQRTATRRANTPTPQVAIKYTGESQLTKSDIDELINTWAQARRGENEGVAFLNKYTEAEAFGENGGEILIEARNANAVDCARNAGVPATMIDATNVKSSMTYETVNGRNSEFIDFSITAYMDPIAARLSLDDMSAIGSSIRFNTDVLRALTIEDDRVAND